MLNASYLYDRQNYLYVYFSKRNQLLRSMNSPKRKILFDRYRGDFKYVIDITEVEVVRGREDSNTPCNKSLTNEDAYALGLIMERVQCVPVYWIQMASAWNLGQGLPTCTGIQYRNVTRLYLKLMNGFGTKNELYRPPCLTMRVSVGVMESIPTFSGVFKLQFEYPQNSYKETTNKREYSAETLLSQVGGFTGRCK